MYHFCEDLYLDDDEKDLDHERWVKLRSRSAKSNFHFRISEINREGEALKL